MKITRDRRYEQHARFEVLRREGQILHEASRYALQEAQELIEQSRVLRRESQGAKRYWQRERT